MALIKQRALVEVSGGMTLQTVAAMAQAGADYISVGALTHSAPQPTSAWISVQRGRRGRSVSDSSADNQPDIDRLQASLHTRAFGRVFRYSATTASTNADALTYVQQAAVPSNSHGLVILTDCQTAGRGRRGRTWHSPPQGNLYFSVIAVPRTAPLAWSLG